MDTIFFIYLYLILSKIIKEVRKYSDEKGVGLKVIYEALIIYLLIFISCSYNLEKIKEIINSYGLSNIFVIEKVTLYTVISHLFKASSILKASIDEVIVKDVVFQLNGWNRYKLVKEYLNELLEYRKIYILHEDRNKKKPRLWIIRGGDCVDISDYIEKRKIYKSHKEYIKLTDCQAKEILKRRKCKGFDVDTYEGDSASILTPWKAKHFYSITITLLDLDYYDQEVIKDLISEKKEMLQILPSDVKSFTLRSYLYNIFFKKRRK
ncbi:hypothetical protein ACOAOT_25030 [Lacrimispora sp. AGF001]|uniref:hypothetical protein n=1 Tax=Lacrimispora sp. AGF001 TaxID=3401631 RepID=UPI003B435317